MPEPLEARRQGVPRGGRRVVEHGHQGRRVYVGVTGRGLGGARHEAPADLGREDERVARLAVKGRADALLAEPVAVEGRGVEIAHARGPGGAHGVDGLRPRGSGGRGCRGAPPEPEAGHPHRGAPERAGLPGSIGVGLMRGGERGADGEGRAKTGTVSASMAHPTPGPARVSGRGRLARGVESDARGIGAQRARTRPGRRPVWRPPAITGSPLTRPTECREG